MKKYLRSIGLVSGIVILSYAGIIHWKGVKNSKTIKGMKEGQDISLIIEMIGEPNSIHKQNDSIISYFYRPPLFSSEILEIQVHSKKKTITNISIE
jgi:hypothetical protein